ncbi:MAG: exo-alpha-sialidase [Gemmatimonadota bacterium]
MPHTPEGIVARPGELVVLVGTMKGAFLFRLESGSERSGGQSGNGGATGWSMDGPHFPGEEVYAMAADQRSGRVTFWAAPGNPFFGTTLRRSDDGGATWSSGEERPVAFPEGSELSLKRIWQIHPGLEERPHEMWLGVEPSCLFRSTDGGDSWAPVLGFMEHEHRPRWTPGAGGLCLHTILQDPEKPERMGVAFSTGGFYRTDDGGTTWHPSTRGVRAEFLPDKHPEFGQCVHKVVHHPQRPERLYLQNHWGLYRSDDWGGQWQDIANGVPSDFGFAMAVHPGDPDTAYIVPLEADTFRCTPEARMRVYRTRDAGGSWHPLTQGLPQEDAYETVLRDALDTAEGSEEDQACVVFGTRSGKIFASSNDGDSWEMIQDGLPPVVCVKAARIR